MKPYLYLPTYSRKGPGEGTEKGGRYMVRFKDQHGRTVTRSTGHRDLADAEKFVHRLQVELDEGRFKPKPKRGAEPKVEGFTVAAEILRYLRPQESVIAPSTFERYTFAKAALLKEGSPLYGVRLKDLTAEHVSRYIYWRRENGARPATALKEVNFLKAVLVEAKRAGRFTSAILDEVQEIKSRRKSNGHPGLRGATKPRSRYLAPHEIDAIFAAIPEGSTNLRDAVTLALFSGLRQGNILSLREGQVSFGRAGVVLRYAADEMKEGEPYQKELSPQAAVVVKRRHTIRDPARRLFLDFRPSWKRLQVRLKGRVDGFTFHDLRHTYGTYRAAAGVGFKDVQYELAHADERTTLKIYTHRATADEREWARAYFGWDLGNGTSSQI